MATKPTPATLTLLLKSHTSTILLHTSRDLPLSTLKANLLSALASRGPTFHSFPLPDSAEDIQFALPVDAKDLSQGWRGIEEEDEDDEEIDDAGRQMEAQLDGPKRGKKATKGAGMCPASLGLRDGSVLAFRFGTGEWVVELPSFEEEEEQEEEEEGQEG
ncbi:hypothetical protein K461DRAFT_294565 [Myriangium duriaei CBS 260.36]|uniref:Uncharacterized protein n=1 Tax=Myriangium duriaei CBS 260.36 TaxID=1168546 RepID=A0A9P4MJ26_9PEZI|nr:hypothetical protein K461DRAFT_294565 [Myriangium duriaei CBS 260.36]